MIYFSSEGTLSTFLIFIQKQDATMIIDHLRSFMIGSVLFHFAFCITLTQKAFVNTVNNYEINHN
jgi:hypothetical protein